LGQIWGVRFSLSGLQEQKTSALLLRQPIGQ
jgi:hypothetical protein